jgi:hypothetical protein
MNLHKIQDFVEPVLTKLEPLIKACPFKTVADVKALIEQVKALRPDKTDIKEYDKQNASYYFTWNVGPSKSIDFDILVELDDEEFPIYWSLSVNGVFIGATDQKLKISDSADDFRMKFNDKFRDQIKPDQREKAIRFCLSYFKAA